MDTDTLLVGLAGLAFAAALIFAMTGSVSKDDETDRRQSQSSGRNGRN